MNDFIRRLRADMELLGPGEARTKLHAAIEDLEHVLRLMQLRTHAEELSQAIAALGRSFTRACEIYAETSGVKLLRKKPGHPVSLKNAQGERVL